MNYNNNLRKITRSNSFSKKLEELLNIALNERAISIKLQIIILIIILIICFSLRIATIHAPALDRTIWKEIDFIYISKGYQKNGFNFLSPEIGWPAEPPRATAMELPLIPYIASFLYEIFGFNVYTVRSITIFAFLLLSIYVFRLTKREFGPLPAIFAAFLSAITPLFHPYNKYLYSDPMMIALSIMSIFHFAEWIDFQKKRDWIMAVGSLSLAISLKLTPLYLVIPILWIAYRKYRWEITKYGKIIIFILIALILPLAWYLYAYHLSKTSIDFFYIFKGTKTNTFYWLVKPYYYKIMAIRIYNILGQEIGTILFLTGIIVELKYVKKGRLFYFYLLGLALFFAIVAQGQLGATYYQLTAIMPLSAISGLGTVSIGAMLIGIFMKKYQLFKLRENYIKYLIVFGMVLISMIGLIRYKRLLPSNPSIPIHIEEWKLAEEIKRYTNPGDKLIALNEYVKYPTHKELSPVLFYYSQLQGWTLMPVDWNIEKINILRKKGATVLGVSSISKEFGTKEFLEKIKTKFKVLYYGENQILIDLRENF